MIDRPRIQPSALTTILDAWRGASDEECCGLLLGRAAQILDAVETANVHPRPESAFAIAPETHARHAREARDRGLDVLGAWHGHPKGPPIPGRADAENLATQVRVAGERRWMVIVGRGAGRAPVVRCYAQVDAVLREVRLSVRT